MSTAAKDLITRMRSRFARLARSTFSSLRTRNFRLYFYGQGISLAGGWIQSVAQSWLVLHLTGSAAALGYVTALQFGPSLLLGPYAGVIADRVSKRRLLIVTQTALGLIALTLGVSVALDIARPWVVFTAAGALGLINAIDYPTRQAFLFELSGPRQIVSAIGLNSAMVNVTRVLGPAIAGALISLGGMASCFFVNAGSFVAVITCLAMMRPTEMHGRPRRMQSGGGLMEGLVYAARTPAVRESVVMMAIIGTLTFEFSVTLPLLVKFAFAADASALAYLMSAMGIGAIAGGLLTAGRREDGLDRLALSALGFGGSTALVGLAPSMHLAAVGMVAVGVFSARFTGISNAMLQLRSTPEMRSRVVALWSTAFMGSGFVGALLMGWLGEHLGGRVPLIVGALGGLLAAFVGWRGLRAAAPGRCATEAACSSAS